MLYEFTFPLRMMGGLAAEIDMRCIISGSHEDWIASEVDVWVLRGGKWDWAPMPVEHQMRPEIIAYLTSPDVAGRIDDAYAEWIAEQEYGSPAGRHDEHRLRSWELV